MARRGADREARPLHHDRLPDERLVRLLGRGAPGGHVVREARPLEHRPACCPSVQRCRSRRLGGEDGLGGVRQIAEQFSGWPRSTSAPAPTWSPPRSSDTPEELAQPLGQVRDWRAGECEPVPGRTMPKLVPVERDYAAVHEKMTALGPLVERGYRGQGWGRAGARSPSWPAATAARTAAGPPTDGRRCAATSTCARRSSPSRARPMALAVEASRALEEQTGLELAHVLRGPGGRSPPSARSGSSPAVIASAEWSGLESRDRRYSPFTANVELLIPWRTLTGRQQLFVDHEWMLDMGEGCPAYRPPVDAGQLRGWPASPPRGRRGDRPLPDAPSKWSIHSSSRTTCTCSPCSGAGRRCGCRWRTPRGSSVDNDWLEVYNRHGNVACRAAVSHRAAGVALLPLAGPPCERPGLRDLRRAAAPTTR